jgi:hypothetical protein
MLVTADETIDEILSKPLATADPIVCIPLHSLVTKSDIALVIVLITLDIADDNELRMLLATLCRDVKIDEKTDDICENTLLNNELTDVPRSDKDFANVSKNPLIPLITASGILCIKLHI